MYYFNIQDILNEHGELSTSQLKIKYIEKFGHCNRNSFGRALKKLVDKGIVVVRKEVIPNKNGVFWFYKLK